MPPPSGLEGCEISAGKAGPQKGCRSLCTSYLSPKGRRLIETNTLPYLAPLLEFFGLSEEDRTFVVRKLNNGLLREEWLMYSILSNHGI